MFGRPGPVLVLMACTLLLVAGGCSVPAPLAVKPASPPPAPTASAPTASAPTSAAPYAGPLLIDHVSWTSDSRGRTLHVYPSALGRTTGVAPARTGAWQEVLHAAPAADTASMRDQFYCHWDFARIVEPNKTSWNLEAWRPDVGYGATVQAQCNPGGPE